MRFKICVFLFLIFSFFFINSVTANNNKKPLLGKVIYLDPGHGGVDPGTIYKSIMEKDINLEIVRKIEIKLKSYGANVFLTRYGDYDLAQTNTINRKRSDLSRRGNMINDSNCDLFISIHLNAESTGIYRGSQAFYNNKLKENEVLAKLFQQNFKKYLKSTRNYKNDNTIYLQKRINRPGVLLEVGFLSNASDRYLLKQDSYKEKVANVITNTILSYFNS